MIREWGLFFEMHAFYFLLRGPRERARNTPGGEFTEIWLIHNSF